MSYYATQTLQPIPMGSYYEGQANLPVLSQDVTAMPESGQCPQGYHAGQLTAGGVSLETPICVKRSFTAMHLALAGLAGLVVGKML